MVHWRFSDVGEYLNRSWLVRRASGRLTEEDAIFRYIPLEYIADEGTEVADGTDWLDEASANATPKVGSSDSARLLDSWNVKGRARLEAAKKSHKELMSIYSRLERILKENTSEFVALVPWSLTYNQANLEGYFHLLSKATRLIYVKFSNDIPTSFNFRRRPSAYKDRESLNSLVDEIKSYRRHATRGTESKPTIVADTKPTKPCEGELPELAKIKVGLESAGYDFEVITAILVKGFNLYSVTPFIGSNYTQDRHVRSNAQRTSQDKEKFTELFESTLHRLLRHHVIIEFTRKSHQRVYSLNPALNQIDNPALRAYVSHLFLRKEDLKRGT